MGSSAERSGESIRQRARNGVGASIMIVLALAGAKIGYDTNKSSQKSSDAGKREKAAAIRRCIDVANGPSALRIESGRAIVKLSALSDKQKEDCDLSSVEDELSRYDKHTGVGIDVPKGAAIIKSDVKVKLPSTGELQASADGELSEANNGITPMEGLERAGSTVAGVAVGGFIGLVVALNAAGMAEPSRRRQ